MAFGSQEDFFDYRFITNKDPDALADFYGTEDFMQMYCVFPFMEEMMMRGSHFDDEVCARPHHMNALHALSVHVHLGVVRVWCTRMEFPATCSWPWSLRMTRMRMGIPFSSTNASGSPTKLLGVSGVLTPHLLGQFVTHP